MSQKKQSPIHFTEVPTYVDRFLHYLAQTILQYKKLCNAAALPWRNLCLVFSILIIVISGNMWTALMKKNQWPQTLQIWTHWIITFGAPCWKSTMNSSQNPRWLMSWSCFADCLGWEELPQDHSNSMVTNFTKHFTPARLPMVATTSICIKGLSMSKSASSSQHQKTRLFSEPTHITGENNVWNTEN